MRSVRSAPLRWHPCRRPERSRETLLKAMDDKSLREGPSAARSAALPAEASQCDALHNYVIAHELRSR